MATYYPHARAFLTRRTAEALDIVCMDDCYWLSDHWIAAHGYAVWDGWTWR